MKKPMEDSQTKCGFCGESFKDDEILEAHIQTEHDEATYSVVPR